MNMRRWFALVALVLGAGCGERSATSEPAAPSPSTVQDSEEVQFFLEHKERWAVKTGADPAAKLIDLDLASASPATVANLRRLPRPPELASGRGQDRVSPDESKLYSLDVEVVRFRLEKEDQDYHVVVRDPKTDYGGSSTTMIVEFPDPTFVSRRSPFRPSIVRARQIFAEAFAPRTSWKRTPGRLRLVGVGFFDFKHRQSGVAPNGFELHPVLGCKVLEP